MVKFPNIQKTAILFKNYSLQQYLENCHKIHNWSNFATSMFCFSETFDYLTLSSSNFNSSSLILPSLLDPTGAVGWAVLPRTCDWSVSPIQGSHWLTRTSQPSLLAGQLPDWTKIQYSREDDGRLFVIFSRCPKINMLLLISYETRPCEHWSVFCSIVCQNIGFG